MRAILTALVVCFSLAQAGVAQAADKAAELRPFGQGSFQAITDEYQGQRFIVNFWSVTCPPCIAEMPLWRQALDDNPQLSLVLVSTDTFEDEERIRGILERYKLDDLGSWVFADPFVERLRF